MTEPKESLDELLQRNGILTEQLSAKDKELNEASNSLVIACVKCDSQRNELNAYKQIVKRLQDRLLMLAEKGAHRKSSGGEHHMTESMKSPAIKPKQMKTEGIVKQDESGFVEICFDPAANNLSPADIEAAEVLIVSEFTDWKPEKMTFEKKGEKAVFVGKYKLEAGYKHRFRFMVNGNVMSDVSLPQMTNPAGYSYNYVIVQGSSEGPAVPMSMEKHVSYLNPNVRFRN